MPKASWIGGSQLRELRWTSNAFRHFSEENPFVAGLLSTVDNIFRYLFLFFFLKKRTKKTLADQGRYTATSKRFQ
jgi:hypothetical protein